MRRSGFLLLLAIFALVKAAEGQGPAPVVLPGPPPVINPEPLSEFMTPETGSYNSYPDYGPAESNHGCEWWNATWYARAELLTLLRNHDPQDRVVIEAATGGAALLSTSDIGFGFAPGVSTLLGHRIDALTAVELAYFGANMWDDERTFARAADLNLAGALGTGLDDFNRANSMEFSLRSQLHNAELNVLRDLEGISLLAGFRYVSWEEQFLIQSTDSDLDVSQYQVGASNNLYGGQLGARLARYNNSCDWELTGKAGLFGDDARNYQRLTNLNGAAVVRNSVATNGEVAFVGDLNLSASCPLNQKCRLRGGYNLMWISGIALAANQLDFSNGLSSGQRTRLDGEVFLHGFNVGLEAIW